MGPFLAEPVSRSCSIALGGALVVALASLAIPCPSPVIAPAPLRLEPIGCKQRSQPGPREVYVQVRSESESPDLGERIRAVAALTVAEHPELRVRFTSEHTQLRADDHVLTVAIESLQVSERVVHCTAYAGMSTGEHGASVSTNIRIDGKASDVEVQIARDACVTSAMEEAVEIVLRESPLLAR